MTKDTERALAAIEPICKELKIKVSADDKFLHIGETHIGISGNSVYATIMEYIGWMFLNRYRIGFRVIPVSLDAVSRIESYYFSDEQLEKVFGEVKE